MTIKFVKAAFAGLVLASTCMFNLANATAINVKTIEISQTGANTLQVSEVVAWGTVAQSDLALSSEGATAIASDYFPAYACLPSPTNPPNADCAIDGGVATTKYDLGGIYEGLWNSKTSVLTITLNEVSSIDFVEIFYRTDSAKNSGLYSISLFAENGSRIGTVTGRAGGSANSTGAINVPEPSTLAIIALGLMGLSLRRFKKYA